jgi:hypothetical protein
MKLEGRLNATRRVLAVSFASAKGLEPMRPTIFHMPGEALFGRAGMTTPYQRADKGPHDIAPALR